MGRGGLGRAETRLAGRPLGTFSRHVLRVFDERPRSDITRADAKEWQGLSHIADVKQISKGKICHQPGSRRRRNSRSRDR